MVDGREYQSLIDAKHITINAQRDVRIAMTGIEAIRRRPLIVYAANMLPKPEFRGLSIQIDASDDLPFAEMIDGLASRANSEEVDLFVATPGGSAHQVSQFVNHVRARFKHVAMIIPHMAMSAGTIWATSCEEIWMDRRATIGPIDPQVPGRDGQWLPVQALLALVDEIRVRGDDHLKKGQQPSWSDLVILRNIDPKELGNAVTYSRYSIDMATTFLEQYKFRTWTSHRDGRPVSPDERHRRAEEIAGKLCQHTFWKAHGHGITRESAEKELRLLISKPEDVSGLERAVRRLWALLYFLFDRTTIFKVFMSQHYSMLRFAQLAGGSTAP